MRVLQRARRAGAAGVMVVATSGLAVTATGTPAAAHNALRSSIPAAGATLASSPAELVMTFSEAPNADFVKLAVTDAAGVGLVAGASAVAGVTLTQPLRSATVAGPIDISFRVVSQDGHPVQGRLSFGVTSVAAQASANPSQPSPSAVRTPQPVASALATASDDNGRRSVPAAVWIVSLMIAVATGTGLLWWSKRRGSRVAPDKTRDA